VSTLQRAQAANRKGEHAKAWTPNPYAPPYETSNAQHTTSNAELEKGRATLEHWMFRVQRWMFYVSRSGAPLHTTIAMFDLGISATGAEKFPLNSACFPKFRLFPHKKINFFGGKNDSTAPLLAFGQAA
jgi:hypothetical protein